MQEGQFYLFSPPFFWTFVGRYVRHRNFQEIVIADAMYLIYAGRPFGELCTKGVVETGDNETRYSVMRVDREIDGEMIRGGVIIPAQGPKFPWAASTPWVKGRK